MFIVQSHMNKYLQLILALLYRITVSYRSTYTTIRSNEDVFVPDKSVCIGSVKTNDKNTVKEDQKMYCFASNELTCHYNENVKNSFYLTTQKIFDHPFERKKEVIIIG